jgi:hypothetical protein
MASPPIIVNKQPTEGDSDVNPLKPIRFGLRDEETRVPLVSTYASVVYARAVYRPEELPLLDPVLSSEGIRAVFSLFNDAAGATAPGDPADQTIETVGLDDVYRIERTTGGAQEGFLYVHDDAQGSQPYAVEAKLEFPVYSVSAHSYVTYLDFTGVLLGLIYWPRQTGVFLFFRDDGTKRITVAGPSADGIGTRPVEATVVFDWSAEAYTYKISWDENPARRKVLVLACDSAGDETILADISTTAFQPFLDSVVLGGIEAKDPSERISMVLGTDGLTPGDYLDTYKADLFRFGRAAVIAGSPGGTSTLDIRPNEMVRIDTLEDTEEWHSEGDGELAARGDALEIERDSDLAASSPAVLQREEPDLARNEWMVVTKIQGLESSHEGSFNTAMGIDIEDGTNRHIFRLLDNFFELDVGIFSSGNIGDSEDYATPTIPFDWTESFEVTLLGSSARNTVRAFLGNDETVAIDTGSYATAEASTDQRITLGFIEDDLEYYGRFVFSYFWVFFNCTFYEAYEATFPEVQGWMRAVSGGARSLVDAQLVLEDTVLGDFDIYYLEDPDYDEESGAALVLKTAVSAWVDETGAVNPPRKEIGPIAYLQSTTVGVRLSFIETEDGTRYAFFSQELSDVGEVLSQSPDGKLLSYQIDFGEDHVYIVDLKPFKHIRLYVDYGRTPVIDIPWESKGLALRSRPADVPVSAVIAFGSLGGDAGVSSTTAFARASIGTGYDIIAQMDFTEEQLQDHVYGSEAEVLVDFEDVDP